MKFKFFLGQLIKVCSQLFCFILSGLNMVIMLLEQSENENPACKKVQGCEI